MSDSVGLYLYTGASLAIALTCTLRFIPAIMQEYGQMYFGWSKDKKMNDASKYIAAIILSLTIAAIAFRSNPPLLPGLALICSALIGVFVLDKEFQVIPDRLHLLGFSGVLWVWLAAGLQGQDLRLAEKLLYGPGLAAVLYGSSLLYERYRKTSAMGLGDIKLFAWLGLGLGSDIVAVIFLSMIGALIWNTPKLFLKQLKANEAFAFGPFIVAATFCFLLL